MKAINIIWDVDYDNDNSSLPTEIEIPSRFIDGAGEFDEEEISDYLSDVTGFCHSGYTLIDDNGNEV